jgi:hypothetical protein
MSDDCIIVEPLEVIIVAESLEVVTTVETLESEVTIGGLTTISNTGSPDYAREEFVVALAGPATIYLDRIPNYITGIYINGLLLEASKYELLGASILMLSTANLLPSDQITIIYY